jgi:hypothetical protein
MALCAGTGSAEGKAVQEDRARVRINGHFPGLEDVGANARNRTYRTHKGSPWARRLSGRVRKERHGQGSEIKPRGEKT